MPVTPMRLLRIPEPFDHPDFIFEPKLDGFRALAHVRGHHCELVSRNGHTFKQWPQLAEEIAHAVRAFSCVLDGEVCCLNPDGRTNFKQLVFRREWPFFYSFDVLSIEGEDLTSLPLLERKRRLRHHADRRQQVAASRSHSRARLGSVRAACELDLEGIVGKWAHGTYRTDGRATSWVKVKHSGYTRSATVTSCSALQTVITGAPVGPT